MPASVHPVSLKVATDYLLRYGNDMGEIKMSAKASRASQRKKLQQGFTLVEMAIVLAVIGLILGAIAIGKDVQRNAEYTKIKNKFIDPWALAYNAYYQRTGVVLGDDQTAPRLMVNGANFNASVDPTTGAVLSGGDMTGVTAPNAICRGATGIDMARDMEATADYGLRELMQRAGVRMPPGRAEGAEDRYVYLDSNGNPQEVQVCFQWNNPQMDEGSGNVMVITGLTPDLARFLDQSIDGKPDAREGMFRQQGVDGTDDNAPGLEWDRNNMMEISSGTTERNRDEDQIATVVAVYQMNQ